MLHLPRAIRHCFEADRYSAAVIRWAAWPTDSRPCPSAPQTGSNAPATRRATANDAQAANASYDEALRLDETERTRYWSIILKLCDIAFVSGDFATERSLREQYYGSLGDRQP